MALFSLSLFSMLSSLSSLSFALSQALSSFFLEPFAQIASDRRHRRREKAKKANDELESLAIKRALWAAAVVHSFPSFSPSPFFFSSSSTSTFLTHQLALFFSSEKNKKRQQEYAHYKAEQEAKLKGESGGH